jgi:two-component system sensor histidine kinase KdpD
VDRAKSDFLANVSHDLRTPLASIQVSLSSLLDPSVSLSEGHARECLHVATEELEQLNTRVRNLLEMSRIEAQAYPLHRTPSDLTDIVAGALERLEPVTRGRPIRADFPPTPLMVDCDPAQIETVILNLVENAVKYSPAGSALHLRGEHRYNSALLFVADEGAGIPRGDAERVFQKFYRGPAHQSIGGTGLGLAICKAIIVAHGGSIAVRNVPGAGAEFGFSLPTLDAPPEAREVELRALGA